MTKSFHSDAYSRFVEVLISARREGNFTQQEVADRLNRPQSYIAKIEGGERRLDVVELIALTEAIEVDPKVVFDRILKALEG